jgi:hypothetical protein
MKATIFQLLIVSFGMIMLLVYGVCRWFKAQYNKTTSYVAKTRAYETFGEYASLSSDAMNLCMKEAESYLASRKGAGVSDVATQLHATLKAAKPTVNK